MNDKELQFRTAAFGGFQKQDVLNYLEASTRETEEKTAALKKRLDEAQADAARLKETVAADEARRAELERENSRLSAELADREARLTSAQAQAAALTAQVAELTAKTEELSAKVTRMSPAAEAYEGLKDRTAGIELEAHSRAREIEAEAAAKAQKTKADLESWLAGLRGSYARLKGELNAALAQAAQELGKAETSLTSISGQLEQQDAALQELGRNVETLAGPKLPDPLPLEDRD